MYAILALVSWGVLLYLNLQTNHSRESVKRVIVSVVIGVMILIVIWEMFHGKI